MSAMKTPEYKSFSSPLHPSTCMTWAVRSWSTLNAGYSGNRLLHEIGRVMLWDDTNTQVLPTLSTVFEEWELSGGSDPALGAGHPARNQLLVGLARYATDIRTNKDSGSATNTAMRFAEGKTTVEAFEK